MRSKERIKPFLDKVDIRKLLTKVWKIVHDEDHIQFYIELIEEKKEELTNIWLKNQDWRFSQLLVNMGIIPNIPGVWYYIEEDEILEELGYDKAECYYWGINFDKDMNLLPKTIYKPIKELNTDHLNAIIDGGFVNKNPLYLKIMQDELNSRE